MGTLVDNGFRDVFDGNGTTTTPYTITFDYADEADVILEVGGVSTTAFSLAADGLRTDVLVAPGTSVVVRRDTARTQGTAFPVNTTPSAVDVEAALNKTMMSHQEIFGQFRFRAGTTITSTGTVTNGEIGAICLTIMSSDMVLTITDGTVQGQRIHFYVYNASRDRFSTETQGGTETFASNGAIIIVEMTWMAASGLWISTSRYDSPLGSKGDIAVGLGNNEVAYLAVGSNGQVLTVDSSTATGLKWATP